MLTTKKVASTLYIKTIPSRFSTLYKGRIMNSRLGYFPYYIVTQ